MIKARFCPPGPAEQAEMWLAAARLIAQRTKQESLQLKRALRTQLARRCWAARKRWRSRHATRLKQLAAKLRLATAIEAEKVYQAHLAQAEGDCTELALRIAAEVLETEISLNPAGLRRRVTSLLDELGHEAPRQIHLHPLDYEDLKSEFESVFAGAKVVAAHEVERGCALVKLPAGQIKIDPFITLEQSRVRLNRRPAALTRLAEPAA